MISVQEHGAELGQRSGQARLAIANKRREAVLALHVGGLKIAEIANRLGFGWRTIYRDLIELADARVRVEEIFEDCGLDATDVHITLSRMHDADLLDIVANPDAPIEEMRYKPLAQWPVIWRQGLAGKVKITPVSERSTDGVQAGESKSWDRTGYKVEIERESLLKILELSAKLKQVDALVQQKAGDTNILMVTPDVARQVVSARRRLERVIDVAPEPVTER